MALFSRFPGRCCPRRAISWWRNCIGHPTRLGWPHRPGRNCPPARYGLPTPSSVPFFKDTIDTRSAVALLFFAFIAGEFLLRFAYDRPIRLAHLNNKRGVVERNIGLMIFGVSTMTILLLVRSIYRTIELSDGWTGTIISTQWLFSSFMHEHLLPPQSADHSFLTQMRLTVP